MSRKPEKTAIYSSSPWCKFLVSCILISWERKCKQMRWLVEHEICLVYVSNEACSYSVFELRTPMIRFYLHKHIERFEDKNLPKICWLPNFVPPNCMVFREVLYLHVQCTSGSAGTVDIFQVWALNHWIIMYWLIFIYSIFIINYLLFLKNVPSAIDFKIQRSDRLSVNFTYSTEFDMCITCNFV
jgi:hypothetical protein